MPLTFEVQVLAPVLQGSHICKPRMASCPAGFDRLWAQVHDRIIATQTARSQQLAHGTIARLPGDARQV